MSVRAMLTGWLLAVVAGVVGATVVGPLAYAGAIDSDPGLRATADAAAFDLGAAVDVDGLGDESYEQLLIDNVNMVSTRRELSFAVVQPEQGTFDFTAAEQIVDFAVANGMTVRGHDLITPDQLPAWIIDGTWTAESLRQVLVDHVATVVSHFAERDPGVVAQWDVVSRAILADGSRRPSIWQTVIGDEWVDAAFTAARAADPDAQLFYDDFYDDFSIIQENALGGATAPAGADATNTTCAAVAKCVGVQTMVTAMLDAGAPIDGIGFQAHMFSPDPLDFGQFSAWVVDLGLQWAFTEFDVPLPATETADATILEFQAAVYGAALESCVTSPSCDTFVTWGITDRFSPIPIETGGAFGGALWFDEQDAPKPAFDALEAVLSAVAPDDPEPTIPTTEVPAPPTTSSSDVADTNTTVDDRGNVGWVVGAVSLGALVAIAATIVLLRRRR